MCDPQGYVYPPPGGAAGEIRPRAVPAPVRELTRPAPSARVLGRAALADDRHLDLPRVLELPLDLAGDLVGQQCGGVVVDLAGGHHHPDLAPGLHRVDLVDAVVAHRDLLEVAQPLDVLLKRLAARPRPGARERVRGLDDDRLDRLRLHLVVMGLHRVRHRLGLAVLAGELAPHERVRPLHLVGHRLADVVQQRGAAGGARAGAELVGHHPGQARDLHRVGEDVLPVAGAEAQPAEQPDQLRAQALHAGVEHRLLAHLHDMALKLGLGLVVALLDARRVDPAVLEQLLERHPRDLAPNPVEPGEHHRARGVVDDEVDPGQVLQRPDVAPLAADDPPLHLVPGELDDGYGRLGGVARGQPLHADGEDVAHPALGLALGLLLDLADPPRRVVARLVLDPLQQQLLGPRRRQAGGLLERALHLLARLGQREAVALELLLTPGQRVLAAGQGRAALERLRRVDPPVPVGRRRLAARVAADMGRILAVDAAVNERSGHDAHRYQRCGHDDFHGRSSPTAPAGAGTSFCFDCGSDRLAHPDRAPIPAVDPLPSAAPPRTAAAPQAMAKPWSLCVSWWGPGGPARFAWWINCPESNMCVFAGVLRPVGPFVRYLDRSTAGAGAQTRRCSGGGRRAGERHGPAGKLAVIAPAQQDPERPLALARAPRPRREPAAQQADGPLQLLLGVVLEHLPDQLAIDPPRDQLAADPVDSPLLQRALVGGEQAGEAGVVQVSLPGEPRERRLDHRRIDAPAREVGARLGHRPLAPGELAEGEAQRALELSLGRPAGRRARRADARRRAHRPPRAGGQAPRGGARPSPRSA